MPKTPKPAASRQKKPSAPRKPAKKIEEDEEMEVDEEDDELEEVASVYPYPESERPEDPGPAPVKPTPPETLAGFIPLMQEYTRSLVHEDDMRGLNEAKTATILGKQWNYEARSLLMKRCEALIKAPRAAVSLFSSLSRLCALILVSLTLVAFVDWSAASKQLLDLSKSTHPRFFDPYTNVWRR
jgi:hypothetical protein